MPCGTFSVTNLGRPTRRSYRRSLNLFPPRRSPGGSALVVDQTSVGRAVVDMLRQSAHCQVVPVTITGGQNVTEAEDGSRHVPKKELVTGLQLLLQGRRLQIARSLPEAGTLVRELENFRVKITQAAHETFVSWREGQHDDLVLAAALACWWAERGGYGAFEVKPKTRGRVACFATCPRACSLSDTYRTRRRES